MVTEAITDNFKADGVTRKSILITPRSVKGNTMLISATATQDTVRLIRSEERADDLPSLQFVAVGDFNTRNLRVALGGLCVEPQDRQMVLPSIERMEALIAEGSLQYHR